LVIIGLRETWIKTRWPASADIRRIRPV